MKEENKIRSMGITGLFMGMVAFFLFSAIVSCCTPFKKSEHLSTREYQEGKISVAEVVLTDSIFRLDQFLHYQCVCRIFWQVDKDIKWVTYSVAPCPIVIGYRMPLLTKR